MDLIEWGGVIALIIVMCGSILVWWLILRRQSKYANSSGNKEYDKLVMRSILPRCHGISIDEVANALKDQDFGGFGLAEHKDGGRQF